MGVEAEDEEAFPDMDDEDAPINMVSDWSFRLGAANETGRRFRR